MEITVDGLETTEGDSIRVNPGEEINYTIHVTNNGPSHGAEGSIVTVYWPVFGENLMEPVTADGEGWSCSGISTITCNHAMQGGEYPPIEVDAQVRSGAKPGVYSSDVKIHKGGWEDPDSENDTAVGSIEVKPFADLTLTKTVQSETDPVEPGAAIDYVLVVTNHGPADATGVTLTDSLPDGVSFLSGQGNGWSCSESDGTVTCTLDGVLPARQLSTVTISVMVEVSDTEISNSASVAAVEEDPDPSDNTSTEVVAVKSLADLSIDMAASEPVYPGETVTYTLQIANGGPDDIAVESGGHHYVEVEAELHPGTTVDWHQLGGEGWGCGIGESGEPHTVHCVRTGLQVGTAPEITIVATLPQTLDELHHTARVIPADYSYDPNPENNTATLALTPVGRPDLVLQKEAPSYAKAGETITYTLTVSNDGQVPAEQLTLSDPLPAALTYESFTDPNGAGWMCEAAGQLVTCTLPGLAVDAQAEVRLNAQVSPTASGALVNTASVSSDELLDMHPEDNAASAETEVDPTVDLEVTLSNGTETAYLETDFTVLMSVTNYGPELADESTVTTFSWTGDATLAGAAGEGWSCNAGETVTCYRTAPLAVDETSVVTVTLRAHSADDVNLGVTSRATVASDWHDPVDSNDSAEITTTIEPAVDLEVAKRATTERCKFLLDDPTCFPAPIVEPGGLLTYSVSVRNLSVIAAPDVTVADELPAGMVFQEFEDGETSCSHDAGVISCMLESLAAGEIFMLTYTASAPESEGPVSNTASAHTTLPDIDAGNDTDSADVRVIPLADLSVTQTVTPSVPVPMQPITFTVQVTNGGPYAAAVTLTDTLPGNTTYLGATGDGWVCSDPVEDELTCTYDLLAVDETTTLDIGFQAGSQPGAIVNRVAVSGPNTADFEMADNDQEQKSIVYPTADLALIQTASAPVVDTGSALTYVLEVINNGPSAASGIVVTDTLPVGASLSAASSDFPGAACGQADGVVTCAINPARDVLLVDATGDEWNQWSVAWRYAQALDELGVPHTRIDAAANPPTAADLSQAPLVIWVLSPWSDGKLSTADETNLAAYLDGGGRLWLVGSSAFSEPVTPFMRDYLGVALGEADIRVDSVSGENAFDGLGPYTLWTDYNLDRLTPTGEGQAAFAAELRSGGEDVPVGVYTDRTVFITFRWDEIYENSAEDGVAVLSAVLDHLAPVLPAGESALVTIQVRTPLAEGPFTNLAEVTAFTYDDDTNNNQAEVAVEAVKSSTPTGPFRYYLPWIMKE